MTLPSASDNEFVEKHGISQRATDFDSGRRTAATVNQPHCREGITLKEEPHTLHRVFRPERFRY